MTGVQTCALPISTSGNSCSISFRVLCFTYFCTYTQQARLLASDTMSAIVLRISSSNSAISSFGTTSYVVTVCMDVVWLAAFADAIEAINDADTSDFLPTLRGLIILQERTSDGCFDSQMQVQL